MDRELDLPVDLNSEDESTLPWGLLSEAREPGSIVEGAWIIVGSGRVRAIAQVAEIGPRAEVVHCQVHEGLSDDLEVDLECAVGVESAAIACSQRHPVVGRRRSDQRVVDGTAGDRELTKSLGDL